MRIYVLFAILLISSTFATETENPLSILLTQVSEQPFGKAIGSLIQLHLKNDSTAPDGKVNAIINTLQQLQKNIEEARERAETRYESKAAWCADTIEQLQKEYESAKSAAA
jgi:FtsZ-binding cell division protein ZapB